LSGRGLVWKRCNAAFFAAAAASNRFVRSPLEWLRDGVGDGGRIRVGMTRHTAGNAEYQLPAKAIRA